MMDWTGNSMNGWGYAFMPFSMLLFWALVITAIVLLVRHLGGPQGPNIQSEQPKQGGSEEILAERFALGEIEDRGNE